jgi:signal transduction histidine kinase
VAADRGGGRAGEALQPSPAIEAAAPERRAFVYALGVADLAFTVIDVASGWPHAGAVLVARGLLASVLLGAAAALGRAREAQRARAIVVAAGALSAACLDVIAWGAGGMAGPYVALLPLLPIILFIAAPDVPRAILACGAVVALPGLAMVVASRPATAALALWTAAFASGTGYGLVGALLHVRVRRREAAAVRELAVSEARRARAERLALAGRLAAGVAHGVNNPLSSVLANVRYVEDAHARAGVEPDVAEALHDARHGLERIRRLVLDLAALTLDVREERGPIEIEPLVEEARRIAAVRGVTVEALELARPLPQVRGRRAALAQLVAGVLVSAAEAARGASGAPAPVRVAARRDGERVLLECEPVGPSPPPDLSALEADPLVLLAREHLEGSGGALEVCPGSGGLALRMALPSGEDGRAGRA